MRHLHPSQVAATLKRGRTVENFLGRAPLSYQPSVRYIELRPVSDAVEVWVHDLVDCGSEAFTDLVEFAPLDDDTADRPLVAVETPESAIAYAEEKLRAAPDRWTNTTVCHEDYADFVRAGRPSRWPVA